MRRHQVASANPNFDAGVLSAWSVPRPVTVLGGNSPDWQLHVPYPPNCVPSPRGGGTLSSAYSAIRLVILLGRKNKLR